MKGTDNFKKVIKDYLDKYAIEDPFFAENYKKENKNINDCCNYIINEVHKSGNSGFTDDEVFNMAIHYYDEDNLEIKEVKNANVVVNHKIELSAEEIEQIKKEAKDKLINQEVNRLTTKPKIDKPKVEQTQQKSLFDL
jgi:hypothetical protein